MTRIQVRFVAVLMLIAATVLADLFFIGEKWPAGPYVIMLVVAAYLLDSRRMIYAGLIILAAEIVVHLFEPVPPDGAIGSAFSTAIVALLALAFTRRTDREVVLQQKTDELAQQEAVTAEQKKHLKQLESERAKLQEVYSELQVAHEELQSTSEELAAQNQELILVNGRLIEAEGKAAEHAKRLEAIQRVTDAALSELHLDDLLRELLCRVRRVVSTDTATILIMDADGEYLTVAASEGFGEEAKGELRLPIGEGIAGRIASSRGTMIFEELSEEDVAGLLLKKRLKSLLGAPLIANNKLIGVLHVGTEHPHHFTEDDVSLVQVVADRVALAIESARLFEDMQYERERWRATVESIPEMVSVCDAEGNAIFVNEAERRLLGHIVEDGLAPKDYPARFGIHKADGSLLSLEEMPLQRAAFTGQDSHDIETRLRTPEGEELVTLWDAAPIRDSSGKIIGAVTVGRDITERKKAEDALRETTDYLENLVNYANAPIIVWDPEFHITRFNHAFEYLTGYSAGEVIGQKLAVLFPENSREESLAKIERTLAGEYWESVEIPILRKDGEIRIALWNSANIHAEDEETVVATIAQGQDITERKQVEQERERLLEEVLAHRQRAEEAVKARDEFLSVASHELKTPVTSMLGFSQLALRRLNRDGNLDLEKGKDLLVTIEQQAEKLAYLIGKLLDISRMEAGKLTLEPRETNVTELVKKVVASSQLNTSGVHLTIDSPSSLTARVDPVRLEQVLANLVENAVKYGGEQGDVQIILSGCDHSLRLAVRDHGPGIPPEHREGVFSRFYQVHKDKSGGGMGLGLYISSEIVALHGGTIEAQFPEDGGTEFVVTLPVTTPKGDPSDK